MSADEASPAPMLGRRVLAAAALALVFAIVFELTIRVEDYLRYGAPFLSGMRSVSDLLVRDSLGMHGRADAVFEKWRMNNLGTRGPDVARLKADGMVRVVVVGASETFGLYESPGREYPRQIEERLNAIGESGTCPNAPRQPFQVLNAAMPGMSLPTIAQDLRLRVRALAPDVVVVYPTPVQYLDDRMPVAARPDSSVRRAGTAGLAALTPRSLGRLRSALKSIIPERLLDLGRRSIIRLARSNEGSIARFDIIPADRLERYVSDLKDVISAIREIGAEPVVVAHLNAFAPGAHRDEVLLHAWERFYPLATGDVIVAFDSVARPRSESAARSTGALFVDASAAVGAVRGSAFADYAHFTDLGAATLAGAIADTVGRRFARGCSAGSLGGTRP